MHSALISQTMVSLPILDRYQIRCIKNPLTIGIDIETGGHVFQLLFTNSRASNDSSFLTETTGDWSKGEISFGFNIVRVF